MKSLIRISRLATALLLIILASAYAEGQVANPVVADSITRQPLFSASVFDRNGKALGLSGDSGRLPYISPESYPITVRYLGYKEKEISDLNTDTIFLSEISMELPEVLVESKQHKLLHILGYVREYSTLSTYTDTVFLFREKMVDYMLVPDRKVKFKGWQSPRILKSNSYYRFTDNHGLDSVSCECPYHFSWSDWVSIPTSPEIPNRLKGTEYGTDTIRGRYSPSEVWSRNGDRIIVDINVLADTTARKWTPGLTGFFHDGLDYENVRVRFMYDNVIGDSIANTDLSVYSFNIESNGRNREMFKFNWDDEPVSVSTYAEVYILDKEFITVKEAKKWADRKLDMTGIEIIEPAGAPELQESTRALIARVNAVNNDDVRLNLAPDRRLISQHLHTQNIAQRALTLLKEATGISQLLTNRNFNRNWSGFRDRQRRVNQDHTSGK